jgi:BirA family biotin operon repressor/biotin-[acetyl-CoA-carboxylase] ligase
LGVKASHSLSATSLAQQPATLPYIVEMQLLRSCTKRAICGKQALILHVRHKNAQQPFEHAATNNIKLIMNTEYPPLDLTFIRQQLAHSPIGHTVIYHTTVPSTMPIAAELAQDANTPSGMVVVAEEQSSGRGRRGRSWHAPYASALLASFVLKPPHTQLGAAPLTMIAGNAILAAVAAVVPEVANELHLKWPNDLVFGNDPAGAAKVAGILAESSLKPDSSVAYTILGIGANVNQQAGHLPRIAPPTPRPISLRVARSRLSNSEASDDDRLIDRGYLLVHLCQQLAEGLALPAAQSYRRWKSHLATLGQKVNVYEQGVEAPPTLSGQAVDVQEDGALVVEDATGTRHTFHAADVSIRAK